MAIQAGEAPDLSVKFTPQTPPMELDAFVDALRPRLRRVIAVFNGKGGQGKTSVASHTAGLLAEGEAAKAESGLAAGRVLLVEVDKQGNTRKDLGIEGHPLDDDGESLAMAVQYGKTDPVIIRDVRPHLDVIPSGRALESLPALMVAQVQSKGRAAWLGLAVVLARLSDTYSWIVIDCPPVSKEPQELALCAARWVLAPVSVGDAASIGGLGEVSFRFQSTAELNPDLELLGAVLFGFPHRYHKGKDGERRPVGMWVGARRKVEDLLARAGSDAPVFDSVIRASPRVAESCRERGQLAYEVAEASDGIKWWEKAQGHVGTVLPSERAEAVGEDYEDLVVEVMERIRLREEEEEGA